MKHQGLRFLTLALALMAGLAIAAGCAAPPVKPAPPAKTNPVAVAPEYFACADKVTREIAPEAEVTEFKCFSADYKKTPSLWFLITVKNVSKTDQRYRVNIFLDNGKAVGGLLPRKTKKGLVKPGATASFKYPIKGYDEKPKSVELIVRTMK